MCIRDSNNMVLDRFTSEERQKIGIHTCPGADLDATHSADVDYAELLPSLFETKVGNFSIAMACEKDRERALKIVARYLKPGQRAFIGVIDVNDPFVETPEEVCARVLEAARHIPVAQLGTTDDCGFSPFVDDTSTSREVAFAKIRARIGVVPQLDTLDTELSVQENLWLYGRFFDLPRAEAKRRAVELLEFAQLSDRADSVVDNLSGGMKRRLSIARSLINNPELLLLDEPTTGLDPQARHVLWDRLYRLKQEGVTQVLTTHYMDEAEQLCDRLVVMDQGRIVAEGSPRSLIEQYSTREVLELRFPAGTNDTNAAQLAGIGERQELLPDRVLVYAHDGEAALVEAHARGLQPESALVRRASLEDVFLLLTGRSLAD